MLFKAFLPRFASIRNDQFLANNQPIDCQFSDGFLIRSEQLINRRSFTHFCNRQRGCD